MVSRFLRAGLMRDRINDILEASEMLLHEAGHDDVKTLRLAEDIHEIAQELRDFIDALGLRTSHLHWPWYNRRSHPPA